jgi:SH3 domain-containing protein
MKKTIILLVMLVALLAEGGRVQAQDQSASPIQAHTLTITKNGNLRSGASTSHEVIGNVSIGMELIQQSQKGPWLQVKLPDGRIGWIHSALIEKNHGSKPSASPNTFVGTLVKYSQSFTPTMQGAAPAAEIEFFLTEHPDKGFSVAINKAIQWGILVQENPVSLRFAGRNWKVQFTTTGKPIEVSGDESYNLYNVKAFKKISGGTK